jgi:hypothetical protein
MISSSPREQTHASKFSLGVILKQYQEEQGCDYRKVHPETFIPSANLFNGKEVLSTLEQAQVVKTDSFVGDSTLGWKEECIELSNSLKKDRETGREAVWFVKTRNDAYSRGVAVVSADVIAAKIGTCDKPARPPPGASLVKGETDNTLRGQYMVQRGMENIYRWGPTGGVMQGRHYLFISNHAPFTAFFVEGHYNVGPTPKQAERGRKHATGGDTGSQITNSMSAQDLPRLTPGELAAQIEKDRIERGLSVETYSMKVLRHRTKEIALNAIMTLKGGMDGKAGGFSLWGFDTVWNDPDLQPSMLEINCGCQGNVNVTATGEVRARDWIQMLPNVIDTAIASQWHPEEFAQAVETARENGELGMPLAKNGVEMLYSDAISPVYSYVPVGKGECYPHDLPEQAHQVDFLSTDH